LSKVGKRAQNRRAAQTDRERQKAPSKNLENLLMAVTWHQNITSNISSILKFYLEKYKKYLTMLD
jgi:hypothetical protein